MTVEPVESPTSFGSGLGVLAGLIASAVTLGISPVATMVTLVGLVALIVGLLLPRPGFITAGAAGLASGVIIAGLSGASALGIAIGFVGAVLAWDVSHNSLSHGRQVGRDAATIAPEAIHAGGSLVVGVLAVAVGYGIFEFATSGQPATAVALLTVGAVLLVLALR